MSEADQGEDFESFVVDTHAVFSRVARAETGDLHSAEDVVQTTYMRMFQKWERLTAEPGSLKRYGRTTIKREAIDQFRRNQRVISVPPQDIPDQESAVGIPDAAYEMIKEGIDDLVAQLPDRQRQVITLCVLHDMSPEDAGKILGLKEESVKRYVHAAIKRLQKSINESSEEVTA
ncbi:RNA polymerase sigma factor [Streptomyces sp. NPDC057116]|uniref:RNA polymerase sigma factor n=1 Tax=Streptomyces sp. NPDC057116 TaxID=3346023 RepID=UPI00363742F4